MLKCVTNLYYYYYYCTYLCIFVRVIVNKIGFYFTLIFFPIFHPPNTKRIGRFGEGPHAFLSDPTRAVSPGDDDHTHTTHYYTIVRYTLI